MYKIFFSLMFVYLSASVVHAQQTQMNYYASRVIAGHSYSEDASFTDPAPGTNYILLHEAYNNNGIMPDEHFVFGKITAIRGASTAYNVKLNLEVNSASAHTTNRASLVSHSQTGYEIVKVTYGSTVYLAVKLPLGSALYNFTFTGYAQNEMLQLVWNSDIVAGSEIPLEISEFDDITFSGDVGIGTNNPLHRLDVVTNNNTENNEIYSIANNSNNSRIGLKNNFQEWNLTTYGSWSTTNSGDFVIADETGASAVMVFRNKDHGGGVGIGAYNFDSKYKLAVEGTIGARKVKVLATGWADYVFNKSYHLPSLQSVEKYITQNNHLPDVPSAATVAKEGIDLGDNQAVLLKKIEELTLYMIQQNKKIEKLESEIHKLKK